MALPAVQQPPSNDNTSTASDPTMDLARLPEPLAYDQRSKVGLLEGMHSGNQGLQKPSI